MLYSTYLRVEAKAGGTACSRREFIRAARTFLAPCGKERAMRDARHRWLRDGLDKLDRAQGLVTAFRL